MISIIVAMGKNGKIGINNKLPWHLPADLKYFARITKNKSVLMGKNTFLSVLKAIGKPLPHRKNIVLLSDKHEKIDGVKIINSIDQVIELGKEEEVFIAGGASVYKQMLPLAEKLYITEVSYDGPCDAFFPEINWQEWTLEKEEPHKKDLKNMYDYNFKIYRKTK